MLVLGAGPAGLTAAYELAKAGWPVIVLEAEDQVGGLAKTVLRDGYRFDLGGHRFFTKAEEVEALWHEVLDEEFLERPRMSRIYWNGRFLDYPLRGPDVIRKLGPVELTRSLASYLRAALRRKGPEETFEQWVSNRFGRRLYEHFFKSYTEKVWGVPTSELRAEWAAQRIRGLSFFSAARAAFFGNEGNKVKSLIDRFHYPRYGPGQLWEAMRDAIVDWGGEVLLEHPVTAHHGRATGASRLVRAGDRTFEPSHVISSLPLSTTVAMSPAAAPTGGRSRPPPGCATATSSPWRSCSTARTCSPTTGSTSTIRTSCVGRIQNYRSWSPWMVPDPSTRVRRARVLLLRGRRAVEHQRRRARRAGRARARAARPRRPRAHPPRLRGSRSARLPDVRQPATPTRVATIRGWLEPGSRTSSRSGATACTATTTPITRR